MDLTHKILSDYSYYLRIERAMSPNTVEAYTSDIEAFFDRVGIEPAQVSSKDILDYLAASDRLSKRSQSRLLSSLRSFFDWLVLEMNFKNFETIFAFWQSDVNMAIKTTWAKQGFV